MVERDDLCPFCGNACGHWAAAVAERDRLRSALLDILVVENLDSAHLLANGALDDVTSELDQVIEYAKARDERDRLRAVVAELQQVVRDAVGVLEAEEVDPVWWDAALGVLRRAPLDGGRNVSEPDENTLRSIGIDGLIELVGVLRRDHRLIVAERDRLVALATLGRVFARSLREHALTRSSVGIGWWVLDGVLGVTCDGHDVGIETQVSEVEESAVRHALDDVGAVLDGTGITGEVDEHGDVAGTGESGHHGVRDGGVPGVDGGARDPASVHPPQDQPLGDESSAGGAS